VSDATRAGVASASTTYSPGRSSATAAPTAAASPTVSMPVGPPKRISLPAPADMSWAGLPSAITRPPSMMTTRSAKRSASSR